MSCEGGLSNEKAVALLSLKGRAFRRAVKCQEGLGFSP